MGAEQSSLSSSHGFHLHGTPTKEAKVSLVKAFHSTREWRKQANIHKGSPQLVVIDFTATWCGPCKFLEPVILDLAAKYTNVIFVKIDVDECMEVAREYEVEAMPTLVLIKEGKEVDRIVGAKKDALEKKIEKHMMPV